MKQLFTSCKALISIIATNKHLQKSLLSALFAGSALLASFAAKAQTFQWFNSAGSDGSGVYSDGTNVYRIGYFSATTTVGSFTMASAGNYDILLSKSDLNGNVIWAKKFGGGNEDRGSGLCVDPTGNIYITGFFTGSTSIGPNTFTNTDTWSEDAYIAKVDPAGNMLWSMQIGNASYCRGVSISADASGNDIYALGIFSGTVTIGPSTFVQSGFLQNNYVIKLNPAGNIAWAKNYGSSEGKKLKTDASGNCYMLGNYFGSTVVGTNTLSSGGSLVPGSLVAKFDPAGTILSAINYRGCLLFGLCLDGTGNIWTTGKTNNTATIGAFTLTTNGNDDIVVAKATPSGSFAFAKNYGGSPSEYGGTICFDASNNIYVAGNKANTQTLGSVTTSGAAFFLQLDNTGAEQWIGSIPGSVLGDAANDLHSDNAGNVFATGLFFASVGQPITVNGTTYTQGGGFLTKLNPGGVTALNEGIADNHFSLYPNPVVNTLTISLKKRESATVSVLDMNGKVVAETEITYASQIDLSGLENGIYFVKLNTGSSVSVKKLIKN